MEGYVAILMPVLLVFVIFFFVQKMNKDKYNAIIQISKNIEDQSKIKDFAAFLSNMPPDIEVITASELNQKITNGEFQISTEFETEEVSNHC